MSDDLIPRAQLGELDRPRDHAQLHRTTMIAVSVGICAWMIRMDPLVGGAFVALWGGWTWIMRRRVRARAAWWRTYGELNRQIEAGDHDAAWRLVHELEARGADPIARGAVAAIRGYLEGMRGELDAACESLASALRRLEPRRRAVPALYAWAARHAALAHLALGRLGVADVYVAIVRTTGDADDRAEVDALRAFAHGRPDELGDDDAVAARIDAARAHGRPLVIAIAAWAYDERGDVDRATPLVAEARDRISDPDRFAALYPRVWAWLAGHAP